MHKHKPLWPKVFLLLVVLLLGACGGNSPGNGGNSPNFTISLNPTSLTVNQGSSGQTTLTLTPQNGFTGAVTLSLLKSDGTAAPAGITLSPTSLNVSGSSAVTQPLTINVGSGVGAGTYNLKVKATKDNITKDTNLTVTVQANNQPNFTISLNPTSLTVNQGSSGQTTLTLTPQNGFTGAVTLSLLKSDGTAAPAGITLSPTSLNVSGSSAVTQPLTINVGSSVQAATYSLKVRATKDNITKEASLSLTVNSGPDFTISLNPTSLTITQGGSGTTQLTLTRVNGFSGTVNLSLVNPPTGVSLSPSSVTVGSSSVTQDLTLSTTANTPVGQQTLTLKATSGNIQKTASLTLTVNQAASLTVNTTDDTIDVNPGDGTCADSYNNCSLRAAIMEANALNTPAVINIPADTYNLTRTSSVDEQGGDLDINSDVTLMGAGAGQTILDGGAADRVLQVYQGKTVSVEGVTVQNGKTSGDGGGIYNEGTLTLTNSTVSGNTANYGGGGISNGGTLTLTNSTVSGNTANYGGGGISNEGTLTLTNSTVSGNTANYGGGGIYSSSTANLSFSTLTGNQATSAGGGIYIYSGTVKLRGVILGGNTSASGSGPECNGSLTSQGYNLIKSNADCGFTAQTTDILNQDPALDALANNSGPTQTHLPAANSPVLDKVPTGDCTALDGTSLSTDQRGVSRPQGAACDIGAVERE